MFPETAARNRIDDLLEKSGWVVQNYRDMNIGAAQGIAVREFPLKRGHGSADYVLYVDLKVVGVVEAKKVGETLTGVEVQTEKYSLGLPDNFPAALRPLPFLYQSTGEVTRFTDARDPDPKSRDVFAFLRPESIAEFLKPHAATKSPTK